MNAMVLLMAAGLTVASGRAENDIQSRIDAAAKAGGGVVEIAAGTHVTDALQLRSGVTLRLAEGAVLQARKELASYAPTEGHAFILAEHADNVAIEGPGVIDGAGDQFPDGSLEVYQQPRLVWFRDSRNVRVENVTLRNGRRWSCYFDRCDGVVARKVRIRSTRQRCCDGFDLECRHALVEDCDIETHDDAICFKNRSSDYTVCDVEVRNCRVASNSNFIKVGTETLGTIRDIRVHHCELHATTHCFYRPLTWTDRAEYGLQPGPIGMGGITLQMNDGGILENVHVHDIDMADGVSVPITVRLTERKRRVMPGRSAIRNVLVENVKGRGLLRPCCSVMGTRALRPSNVVFRNIALDVEASGEPSGPVPEYGPGDDNKGIFHSVFPSFGFYLSHADDIRFENVRFHPRNRDKRNLITTVDCTNVDTSGLSED